MRSNLQYIPYQQEEQREKKKSKLKAPSTINNRGDPFQAKRKQVALEWKES